MSEKQLIILAHGGAGSDNAHSDGTDRACQLGLELLQARTPVLEAACRVVEILEDDPRFNAGTGSRKRTDGTVRMDAACMDSHRRFGAVSALQHIKNPIHVARHVADSENRLLTGEDALQYALELGFEKVDMTGGNSIAPSTDTVGAVVFDGTKFAAALSTGGTGGSRPGRVGDVPLIGCGLYAGEHGAVCCTGHGESITLNLTAYRTYAMLEQGIAPQEALDIALSWFEDSQDIGLLIVNPNGHAGGSNRSMAWSTLTGAL
ncbi:MAG: isoaspartyl peptidase/L-asparaginase [Nitrospinota bacterium]|nr:isoaspartyl peptidase/L-asparaginase [Nitrospinota bacterium]